MGLAVGVGVAVGSGVGAALLLRGGVAEVIGFCGAVAAAAGVALSGRPVAEVVARKALEHMSPRIEMVAIPGGTFWMGSAEDDPVADADERPLHEVTLSPFWMAKVPVTQKLYHEVTGESPERPQGDDLSVNEVS
jgi:formylglycine-generating enzyme required for sulfatase activity